jgi:hypothetical protein
MQFLSWLRVGKRFQGHASGRGCGAPRPRATFRPRLEALEGRDVPSTLIVMNNLDSGPGSLRAEIAAAHSGDLIDLSGRSGQTIALTGGELVLNKSVTIQGPSALLAPVTISGDSASRVFEVDGSSTTVALSNLKVIDGTGVANNAASAGATDGQGGAIWNGGTLTVTACTLSDNTAYHTSLPVALGGAIYNAGTLTVSASTVSNNSVGIMSFEITVGGNGGAIYNAATLEVSNSILSNNTANGFGGTEGGYGGGLCNAYKASAPVTTDSSLTGNVAHGDGGGISNDGSLTLSGTTVSGNTTNGRGGGIFNDQKGHLAIQSKSSVVNNGLYDLYNLGVLSESKDSTVGLIVT